MYDSIGKKASLSATFTRPLGIDGIAQEDFLLVSGSVINAIWAHGVVVSATLQSHKFTSDDRDTFQMVIPYLRSSSALMKYVCGLYLVVLGSLLF